ncbi:MAG: cysteine desulfurase [Clostridiales bacterium]|nr:cysteine desulfurase [Clostridiales bacterium]
MPEVIDLIRNDLSDPMLFGNPGSLHRLGMIAEQSYAKSISEIAQLLKVSADELIVTSGGTEAINTALIGFVTGNPRNGNHIISTKAEHMATLETLKRLEKLGFEITYIPIKSNGKPDYDALESSIRKDTVLISMTHTNNETGAILPVERLIAARNRNNKKTAIHLDCVQSLGKIPLYLRKWNIDLASFSGHKIHCVKGVGILFVRKGIRISPLITGGDQQRGLRSGTQSPWLAHAFSCALQKACLEMDDALPTVNKCKTLLCDKITSLDGTILSPTDGSPYIVNAALGYFQSETLLHALETFEIYISTVSACTSKKKKKSHVLSAMGVKDEKARNAVRFSFSRFTTVEELNSLSVALDRIVEDYRLK